MGTQKAAPSSARCSGTLTPVRYLLLAPEPDGRRARRRGGRRGQGERGALPALRVPCCPETALGGEALLPGAPSRSDLMVHAGAEAARAAPEGEEDRLGPVPVRLEGPAGELLPQEADGDPRDLGGDGRAREE
eukprot:7816000-Alexandrium_andersonii.AAC.1